MESLNLASKLQRIADYRTVRKTLKTSSTWSILFGLLALAIGLWTPVDWLLAGLGAVLLGTGIWNLVAPRPTGIVVDGIALLLIGIYNVSDTILSALAGRGASGHWVVLGGMQLLWGAQRIMSFGRFANAFAEKPSDTELAQIEETIGAIRKAKPKESSDIIEFMVEGVHRQTWKGRLWGSDALFVEAGGSDVLVGTRDAVEITTRGKVMIGSALKADLTVAGTRLRGTISPDSYRLYEQWKTGVFIPRAIAA